MKKVLCYYHENCVDGFMSWFIVHEIYPDAIGVPYNFKPMPTQEGEFDLIICVDCVVPEVINYNKPILIIDHHKGNLAALGKIQQYCQEKGICLETSFTEDKSGAYLTWEWFHPHSNVPWLVYYISDRDTWQWLLTESKEINEAIRIVPFTLDDYLEMWQNSRMSELAKVGRVLLKQSEVAIERCLKHKHLLTVSSLDGSYSRAFESINSQLYQSEIGNAIAQSNTDNIGLVYYIDGQSMRCSLRSIGDVDVSEIAKRFGGGGHKNAAGFEIPIKDGKVGVQ